MKWTDKDERCVKRFAFLPYENEEEVRWLETVYIWQSYNPWGLFSSWKNQRFATKEEYLNWKKKRKHEAERQKISDEMRNRMLSTKKCDICAHTYEPYGANKDDEKPYCDHVIFMAKDKPMDTLELCPNCMERLCHTILEWGEGEPNG